MIRQNNPYANKTPQELAAIMQEHVKGTFSDFLDMTVLEYQEGYCKSKFAVRRDFMNPLGSIHGGYLFTIADTTAGMASIILGSDSTVTTIDGNMQFLNPAMPCDALYAEATVLKSGKRIVYTDVVISDGKGKIFAKGSYSFARIILPHVVTPAGE